MVTPFLVGASSVDITPPLEVGILMSAEQRQWAPFEAVRLPLSARAVVMAQGTRRVALVSLDLLGLAGRALGGRSRFKNRIVEAAERAVRARDLVMVATHTHSAPESLALTDLYHTPAFKAWRELLAARVGAAIKDAAARLRPAQPLIGTTEVAGLAIYRRIKTVDGIVLSHPPPPPEKVISRDGPVDESVNIAAFLDELGQPVAILVNATCHPVHEMCLPSVSPDYPGEMSLALERRYPATNVLFLNGAAGNINPPVVSGGPAQARQHGHRLAEAVTEMLPKLRPIKGGQLALHRRALRLPARTLTGKPAARALATEIAALTLGEAAFLFIPGEPFVELGLMIRQHSPYEFTAVVGYAEDTIGYIPTDQAFTEGGYELGPGPWAIVGYGAAGILQNEALALLDADRNH